MKSKPKKFSGSYLEKVLLLMLIIPALLTCFIVKARINMICPDDVHPSSLPGACYDGVSYAASSMSLGIIVFVSLSLLTGAVGLLIKFFRSKRY